MKKSDVHIIWHTKMCTSVFSAIQCARRFLHSYLKETKKINFNSYNLISYHFHTKSKGKQP